MERTARRRLDLLEPDRDSRRPDLSGECRQELRAEGGANAVRSGRQRPGRRKPSGGGGRRRAVIPEGSKDAVLYRIFKKEAMIPAKAWHPAHRVARLPGNA